jgi:flagellar basal body rod protein FlgG
MIVSQRAYELNSKVVTTSDEMLAMANNLKR